MAPISLSCFSSLVIWSAEVEKSWSCGFEVSELSGELLAVGEDVGEEAPENGLHICRSCG